VYVRVVRFADVRAERVQQLVARIEESGGPPPGVPSTGIQLLFDESEGTALVLQLFETVEDMRKGDEIFGAMNPADTPERGCPWTCVSSSSSATYLNRIGRLRSSLPARMVVEHGLRCSPRARGRGASASSSA